MSKPYSFHLNNSVSHVEKDGSHIYIAQLVDEANQQHEKLEALNAFVAAFDEFEKLKALCAEATDREERKRIAVEAGEAYARLIEARQALEKRDD